MLRATRLWLVVLLASGCSAIFDPASLRGEGADAGIDAGMDAAAGSDGGHDAGDRDAGDRDAGEHDAGDDAGHDAGGMDAALVDAGSDAGSDAGFDAGCMLAPSPPTMSCGFPASGTRIASAEITECAGGASTTDSSWWLAWRFQMPADASRVTAVGFHGIFTGEVFGGLVPLTGPTDLPGAPPPQSAFLGLIGCGLTSAGAQDVQLGFDLAPTVVPGAWYAAIIGSGRYGILDGSTQITRSTVPRDPGLFAIEVAVGTTPHAFASRVFVDYE